MAFYEATSAVTEHGMVRKWVEETFPVIKAKGWRDHHANAANIGGCLRVVAPGWSDDPKKKAQYDAINDLLLGGGLR